MCLASILDITLSKRFAPIKLAAEIAEMCGVVVLVNHFKQATDMARLYGGTYRLVKA